MERREINRLIREALGVSGRQLSELVEVTKQTISNYERGVAYSRPLERVIEWELDAITESCDDADRKTYCEYLKTKR